MIYFIYITKQASTIKENINRLRLELSGRRCSVDALHGTDVSVRTEEDDEQQRIKTQQREIKMENDHMEITSE